MKKIRDFRLCPVWAEVPKSLILIMAYEIALMDVEISLGVLHFVNNSFESSGIVEGEVGENFAVDLDAGLVDEAHEQLR